MAQHRTPKTPFVFHFATKYTKPKTPFVFHLATKHTKPKTAAVSHLVTKPHLVHLTVNHSLTKHTKPKTAILPHLVTRPHLIHLTGIHLLTKPPRTTAIQKLNTTTCTSPYEQWYKGSCYWLNGEFQTWGEARVWILLCRYYFIDHMMCKGMLL